MPITLRFAYPVASLESSERASAAAKALGGPPRSSSENLPIRQTPCLNENRFTFPSPQLNLVALQALDISNNQLQALPPEIGTLWTRKFSTSTKAHEIYFGKVRHDSDNN